MFCSASIFAYGLPDTDAASGEPDPNESEPASCGPYSQYTYNSATYVLKITGSGSVEHQTAWDDLRIKTVDIGEGITGLSPRAFMNMEDVYTAKLPSSLSVIDTQAFAGCTNLDTLSEIKVTTVGNQAFRGCTELIDVKVTADTVGEEAFAGCTSLETVKLKCTGLGKNALMGCNYMTSLTMDCGTVGVQAFAGCTSLPSVAVKCASLGEKAFYNCSSLGTVSIVSGSIGRLAFMGCGSVTELNISGGSLGTESLEGMKNVRTINLYTPVAKTGGWSPFSANGFATEADTCTMTVNCRDIGEYTLYNCSAVDRLVLGSNVTAIPANAFNGTTLKYIEFGCQPLTLANSPFQSINGSFEMKIVSDAIPAHLLQNVKNVTSVYTGANDSVDGIGEYAFSGTAAEIVLDLSADYSTHAAVIESHAFADCGGTVVLSSPAKTSNTLSIGSEAFSRCSNADLSGVGYTLDIGSLAFAYSDMTVFDAPHVKSFGDKAFLGCTKLTDVTLPYGAVSLGSELFSGCQALEKITYNCPTVWPNERTFVGTPGDCVVGFGDSMSSIPENTLKSAGIVALMNENITSVGNHALSGCVIAGGAPALASITDIGEYAFENCYFSATDFSECTGLKNIGKGAFNGSQIEKLYIFDSLKSIGADAFDGCGHVGEIMFDNITAGLYKGGDNMFAQTGAETGTHLYFGDSVTFVPDNTFKGAAYLKSVDLSGITSIGTDSFANTGIREVTFPEEMTYIADWAFSQCNGLTELNFLNDQVIIGSHAFMSGTAHLDTYIHCQRHSTASDYPWADDKRDEHMDYSHVEGEYSGMMSIIFNILEAIFGADIANAIIDFFFDNVALNILESIDLGSDAKNAALLAGIAVGLLLLLFLFLFIDVSEGIRVMEVVLAMGAVLVIAINTIRLLVEYPDWYSYISILVGIGILIPLISGIHQIRSKRMARIGETLLRLYSVDNDAIKHIAKDPWVLLLSFLRDGAPYGIAAIDNLPRLPKLILGILMLPFGAVLSAVYTVSFLLFHLPAYLFSLILVKIFSESDRDGDRHVDYCVCPRCGFLLPSMGYVCDCGKIHYDLRAGKYGVHKAICGSCGKKIKCGYKGHRWDTCSEICTNCKGKLDIHEAEPFVVSMVGAEGAGKTALMRNAYRNIGGRSDLDVSFSPSATEALVRNPDMTPDPTSYRNQVISTCLFRKSDGWKTKAVYSFDIGGEYFTPTTDEKLPDPKEYEFADGAIFVINPYHISEFCRDKGVKPSDNDQDLVMSSFLEKYILANGLENKGKHKLPIAVVLSRCDEAGIKPSTEDDLKDTSKDEEIRRFLELYNMDMFLNNLGRFSNVRMFAYDESRPDCDRSAVVPYEWIMTECNRKMNKWMGLDN